MKRLAPIFLAAILYAIGSFAQWNNNNGTATGTVPGTTSFQLQSGQTGDTDLLEFRTTAGTLVGKMGIITTSSNKMTVDGSNGVQVQSAGTGLAFFSQDNGGLGVGNFGLFAGSNPTTQNMALRRSGGDTIWEFDDTSLCSAAPSHCIDTRARHYLASGAAVSIASGGGPTTPAVLFSYAHDEMGRVTLGTGVFTNIVLNFGTPYSFAPHCTATDETAGVTLLATATTSQLTIVVSTVSDVVSWECKGALV